MPIKFYDSDGNEVSEINEGENVDVNVTLTDEADTTITPATFVWWWSDANGTVINSRDEVSATPGNPTVIKLLPADTTLTSDADAIRYLTIKATYDSSLGTGRTVTEWGTLLIRHSKVI